MNGHCYQEWMWCVRYLKGVTCRAQVVVDAVIRLMQRGKHHLHTANGVLEMWSFDYIEEHHGPQSPNAWSNPLQDFKKLNEKQYAD